MIKPDYDIYPYVSVIIPVYNEAKYIESCLHAVNAFNYPKNRMEIIIVDGNSTDKTVSIIQSHLRSDKNLTLLTNEKKIVPVSLNLGIAKARGAYIIRLDAHSHYPVNYISELIKNAKKFKTDNIGTVCITEVLKNDLTSRAIKLVLADKFGVGNSLFRIGINHEVEADTVPFGCFLREIFDKVGYFDERLIRNQDIEINKRIKKAGGKILLLPEPKSIYYARENISSFAYNNFLNGKWNILTCYFTRDIKSISFRHYVPFVFVLSILIPLFCYLFSAKLPIISASIIIIYLFFIIIRALILSRNPVQIFYIVLVFMTLHFSYGLGSLIGTFQVLLKISGISKP